MSNRKNISSKEKNISHVVMLVKKEAFFLFEKVLFGNWHLFCTTYVQFSTKKEYDNATVHFQRQEHP